MGRGVAAALERACVLLGKCQKPLVKKPYGNYSTQLNMKCGKGSAQSVPEEDQEEGGKGNRKKLQRWANNEKYTHITVFFSCLHSHTHTRVHTKTNTGSRSANISAPFSEAAAVAAVQLLPPGNFSVIKYLNLIKATNEQHDLRAMVKVSATGTEIESKREAERGSERALLCRPDL